jgi:hypothetical protein
MIFYEARNLPAAFAACVWQYKVAAETFGDHVFIRKGADGIWAIDTVPYRWISYRHFFVGYDQRTPALGARVVGLLVGTKELYFSIR